MLAPGLAGATPPVVVPTPPLIATLGTPGCSPGAAGCGQALLYPSGGDVDAAGNIYTADTANGQIEAWDASGNQLWRVGQTVSNRKSLGEFLQPRDLAYLNAPGYEGLNGQGLLFIANLGNNRVDVLNAADGSVNALSLNWTTRFNSVIGISSGVDSQGQPIIVATDSASTPVREFQPDGTLITTVGAKCNKAPGTCPPNQLLAPRDSATDAAGNVFVADYTNDRIVEFDANDLTSPVLTWGARGSGPLQFNRPYGIALDDAGHVYVADSGNNRIQEFDVSGVAPAPPVYLATYGGPTGTIGNGRFITLRRVAVGHGPTPRVFGFDLWGNSVDGYPAELTYPATGTQDQLIGGSMAAPGGFNSAYGLTVGGGEVFIADTNNQRIQAFGQATNAYLYNFGQRGFGESNLGFNWPRDVTFAAASNTLWVADTKNFRVTEFSLAGVATGRVIGKVGVLNWPYSVAAYGNDVMIADTVNNRVQLWDPATSTVVWSTDALGISMAQPRALTIAADYTNTSQQDVYVADSLNHRVVVLNADTGALVSTITPLLKGVPALHRVEGVAVDPRSGNLWVADSSFNRLIEVSPAGDVLLNMGKIGSGPTQFNLPTHLAITVDDTTATLYVCDVWNNRIQVFNITNF